jgi:hypothetical protein
MTRAAIVALLALSAPAQACHRYTVWRYHFAQNCAAQGKHGYEPVRHLFRAVRHGVRDRRLNSSARISQADSRSIVQPLPPDAPSPEDIAKLRAALEGVR